MILLDTNVVSAVMKSKPVPAALEWLGQQNPTDLYLSSVSIAEILFGLRILPEGKRRSALEIRFEQFLDKGFSHRILPFDEEAARRYADLMAERRRLGRPMSQLDGQIAAIAQAHRFSLATGNTRDFEECKLPIINPFEKKPPQGGG